MVATAGPTLGGYVTTFYSEQHSATVAAALCLVAIVIIMATVPSTTKDPVKVAAAHSKENKQYGEWYAVSGVQWVVYSEWCAAVIGWLS